MVCGDHWSQVHVIVISCYPNLFINSQNHFFKLSLSLLVTRSHCSGHTSSTLPHSAYPNTGTPSAIASIVAIPQLSLERLMSHLACCRIFIFCFTSVTLHINVTVGQARDLRCVSSGPDHITMSGTWASLHSWMILSTSLTKLVNLPIYTK